MILLMSAKAPDSLHPQGRRKCRIVINGSTFESVYDYDEHGIYSGVADRTTTRIAFGYANEINAKVIRGADLETSFLYAKLKDNEEVYVYPIQGMTVPTDENGKKMVFRVLVAVYGMPQAAARLSSTFDQVVATAGCYPTKSDPSFYVMKKDDDILMFPRHVDDMSPIVATSEEIFNIFITAVETRFRVQILNYEKGDRCLGMEVNIDRLHQQITLTSERQIESMLKKCGFEDVFGSKYPMKPDKETVDEPEIETDLNLQQIGGHLLFLGSQCRPDACIPASIISSEKLKPTRRTEQNAKQTMGYFKREKSRGLRFTRGSKDALRAIFFVDANWGGSRNKRSRHGYIVRMFGGTIVFKCALQKLVTLSSTWSETVGLSEAMRFNRWLRCFLLEIGLPQDPTDIITLKPSDPRKITLGMIHNGVREYPTHFLEDNQAAIALSQQPVNKLSDKSRHIGIRDFFCKECVASGEAKVFYVPTKLNVADFLTKILSRDLFINFRDQIMGYRGISFLSHDAESSVNT